ncbi:MAG: asparagine synthase (glutamine-hydrolyzing), partial [Bacteroidales bacterium]|nr:asparagine synthase (glutamine-hydrolyzing) [Bacteroidales bacterium]
MCGFTGYINFQNKFLSPSVIKQMTNSIHHRGPDDEGYVLFSLEKKAYSLEINENNFYEHAAGFRRLSIVDLSPNGHQPMISQNNKTILLFNGEIYNAFQFKDDLIRKGCIFKSKTDTEIILHLYEIYGIHGLLQRIEGMFAIVIIDLEQQKVFLIRDHFGIKPLYYFYNNEILLFSSEIKSFYYHPSFKAELNEEFLSEYFYFKYVSHPDTLLKNVYQVPPASFIELSNNQLNTIRYWHFPVNETLALTYTQALEIIDDYLKKSVKSQLLGDVKIGCQLSGGIDSSLITNYAREYFEANLDTFSIIFDNPHFSELPWINQVNNKTKSTAHIFIMNAAYFFNNLYHATWHMDQPLHLPNSIAIKLLSQESQPHVTVLLSGEGADELFGGYSRFYDIAYRSKHYSLLYFFQKITKSEKLQNKYHIHLSIDDTIVNASATMPITLLNCLLNDNNIDTILNKRKSLLPNSNRVINNMSIYEMQTYMTDLLIRQDKMTMAHSIENRVPFLDKTLVEFVLKLPDDFKIHFPSHLFSFNKHHLSTKKILKDLAIKKFNKQFVYRSKSGFALPLSEFFNHSGMQQLIQEKIYKLSSRNILNSKSIQNIHKEYLHNNISNLKIIWQLLSFEIWYEIFIEQSWQP